MHFRQQNGRQLRPLDYEQRLPEMRGVVRHAMRAEAIPETLGHYCVIERLGRGAFGTVYLAHDDQLERPVAIKVPVEVD